MWPIEDHFRVIIGGDTYIDTPNVICYKGEPILKLNRRENDGLLGISFELFDKSGTHVAAVRQNQIYKVGDHDTNFEITHKLNCYSLVDKGDGREVCKILIRNEATPAELRLSAAMYMPDGFLINLGPERTELGNSDQPAQLWGNISARSPIGLNIGEKGKIVPDKTDDSRNLMESIKGKSFVDQTFCIDGKEIINCTFKQCLMQFGASGPYKISENIFDNCRWELIGAASLTIGFLRTFYLGGGENGKNIVNSLLDDIKRPGHIDD